MVRFRKILFPTDFSPNSHHALAHAVRLTDFHTGELIVQHVVSDYFDRHPHWTTLFDIHELQKHLDAFVDAEMARILSPYEKAISVRRVISKGKPAEEISALAQEEFVDLIVMGSAKGVVTNKVIRMTDRPVLAVSSGLPGQMDAPQSTGQARRILVTTDLSEHSRKIVRYAFELKEVFDASIYLLHVIETTRAVEFALKQGHYTNAREKMREWALNQLVNLVPSKFITDPAVVTIVESGNPSEKIMEVAREIGADLIMLGTHEYGVIQKHLLGTTTDKVLSTISTPLLTVKL
jgi:nucleotide-binding universal stress UspA family protein